MLRAVLCALSLCAATGVAAQSISVEELAPAPVAPLVPENRERVERVEAETGNLVSLRGLDKVNGKSIDVEVRSGGSVEIFGLLVTLRECRYPAENPTGDAYAFLSIRDPQDGRVFFDGWMIASSPALNALDHRRYDVWVLRCKSV
ncbi:DUF2155 domain-containing protein [Epibacterium sp. Ofav1-8]|uniref:DUF2155 domain-containing protein n=1 Tax=Epibacterium sp. Ofav1-8 TaxID=2917735 RepID=UPI001EF72131|nr:DUF2155 domain-containing protein [Epibacterium sp. Ofav1-8]MCG7622385.1 DUF2155 domain-containing protein [Epibacterium sp. Ofav1-8]